MRITESAIVYFFVFIVIIFFYLRACGLWNKVTLFFYYFFFLKKNLRLVRLMSEHLGNSLSLFQSNLKYPWRRIVPSMASSLDTAERTRRETGAGGALRVVSLSVVCRLHFPFSNILPRVLIFLFLPSRHSFAQYIPRCLTFAHWFVYSTVMLNTCLFFFRL